MSWAPDPGVEGGLWWLGADEEDGHDVGEAFVYLDETDDVLESRAALVQCVRDADKFATLVYGLRDTHYEQDGWCAAGCNEQPYPCTTATLVNELAGEDR